MSATISTHVLDTALGKPARGVRVTLDKRDLHGAYRHVGSGETDTDGRLKTLVPPHHRTEHGVYRLTFDTGEYARAVGHKTFFPEASIVFEIDADAHYHVPLLFSPFGYATYRGS